MSKTSYLCVIEKVVNTVKKVPLGEIIDFSVLENIHRGAQKAFMSDV
jgi:hypothetical protein